MTVTLVGPEAPEIPGGIWSRGGDTLTEEERAAYLAREPEPRLAKQTRDASERPLVVVGGAAGGVGQVVCLILRQQGFYVVGVDRQSPVDCVVTQTDLAKQYEVATFFETLREEHRELHGYVSLVWGGTGQGFLETSSGDLEKTWRDTFLAALYPVQEAARWMKETGGGYIVLASSINSVLGLDEFSYDAAKGAVNRIAPDIATSCGKHGVYATTLLPGTIGGTPSWVGKEAELERIAAEIPDGRVTDAREVAEWIAFLLSGGIKAVNGQEIRLDRGWSISKPGFKK